MGRPGWIPRGKKDGK